MQGTNNHHDPHATVLSQAQAHRVHRRRHRRDRACDRWLRDHQLGSGSSNSTNTATAGKVIPFDRGNPSPATKVGQILPNFTDGSGVIITETASNKAKGRCAGRLPRGHGEPRRAAEQRRLRRTPDRRQLAHHIFVNKDFKVVGAE
jgi:hypothetical protein